MDLRIRKPHSWKIDEALEKGEARIGLGGGLYLHRIRDELDGAFNVRPRGRDIFEIIRGEEAVKKVDENANYSRYRRLGKRWTDLI